MVLRWLIATAGLTLVAVAPLDAAVISWTRLIGSGDTLPDTPPGYQVFAATRPHLAGENVVFAVELVNSEWNVIRGVWMWDGASFHRVIDSTMPEGQAGILTNRLYSVGETGLVVINVEAYAVLGWTPGGSLAAIAVDGQAPPDGPPGSAFVSFTHPTLRGGTAYFSAALSNLPVNESVRPYSWSSAPGLAEISLSGLCCFGVPGPTASGFFLGATDPTDPVAARAVWWVPDAGVPLEYFRLDSGVPGAPPDALWLPNYKQLGALSDSVALNAADSTYTVAGMFRVSPGGAEVVLLEGDPDPGSGQPVGGIYPEYSADGDRIAFNTIVNQPWPGYFPGSLVVQEGDRSLRAILSGGDILEGQQVAAAWITYGALSGDRLAVEVQRAEDGAVWIADLTGEPAPSPLEIPTVSTIGLTLFLFLLAIGGLATVNRRGHGREPAAGE